MKTFRRLLPFLLALAPLTAPAAEPGAAPAGPGPEARPGRGPRGPMVRPGPAPERERVAFLGAEFAPVPPVAAAQLGLPRESGLVVGRVAPNSPSQGALREHDVVTHLDDQVLINPPQLAALVRQRGEGTEVSLTYFRGGKKETVRVKLGGRDEPKRPAGGMGLHRGWGAPGRDPGSDVTPGEPPRRGPAPRSFPPREGAPAPVGPRGPAPAPGSGPG